MNKVIIALTVLIILLVGGMIFIVKNKQNFNKTAVNAPATAQEGNNLSASAKVGYIDFEAVVATKQNFNELNSELGGKLDKSAINSSTQIALIMNNHRENLSVFDYKNLSTLDGVAAQSWRQLGERMGGHHVNGALIFPKTKNPQSLVITGLPVGDVVLTF